MIVCKIWGFKNQSYRVLIVYLVLNKFKNTKQNKNNYNLLFLYDLPLLLPGSGCLHIYIYIYYFIVYL